MSSWVQKSCSESDVIQLVRQLGLSPWKARFLASRGYGDSNSAQSILNPRYHSPDLLPDALKFLDRLRQARENHEQVMIHGDYDVDGITSVTIMEWLMNLIGIHPRIHLPSRFEGGYGLRSEWVQQQARDGIQLIVTVDCGASADEAEKACRDLGISLAITDHHPPKPGMENCGIHVNPKRSDSQYPWRDLCGAGIVLKLAQLALMDPTLVPAVKQASARAELPVHLAMLGTIADVVPLQDENRRIVQDGLDAVAELSSAGLLELFKKIRVNPRKLDAETVAFQVAPRLNAAGRMEDPITAYHLLTCHDSEQAGSLVKELEKFNRRRKQEAERAVNESLDLLKRDDNSNLIIAESPDWHQGILGILAARLMDQSGLPVLAVTQEGEEMHGSMRVPEGFHAGELLHQLRDLTTRGGGHQAAAGLSVPESCWEDFKQRLRQLVDEIDGAPDGVPGLEVESFVETPQTAVEILEDLSGLEPFGEGFHKPVVAVCQFRSTKPPEVFGEKHLRLALTDRPRPVEAVGFSMAEEWGETLASREVDLALEYSRDNWGNAGALRPRIVGIRPPLKETCLPGNQGEVMEQLCANATQRLVIWDGRGRPLLETPQALRIGYGPDWVDWWTEKVAGSKLETQLKIWRGFRTLPQGDWPAGLAISYQDEIPGEWPGEVLELLWPPMRKEDLCWLQQLAHRSEQRMLVRLAYQPEFVKNWIQLIDTSLTREEIGGIYRMLSDPDCCLVEQVVEKSDLPGHKIIAIIEIMVQIGLLDASGGQLKCPDSPTRVPFEDWPHLKERSDLYKKMQHWQNLVIDSSAAELGRKWLG